VVEIVWWDTSRMRTSNHFSEASLVLPQNSLTMSRTNSLPSRTAGWNKGEMG
jgi:hypothetical protein